MDIKPGVVKSMAKPFMAIPVLHRNLCPDLCFDLLLSVDLRSQDLEAVLQGQIFEATTKREV
ncbi:hypothetical protein SADUNF_Sadunf09G0051700 [Salix dunnii]|uniref:Uncharacterized protein n=1 Tax=Salix dunnii TaxID=1413687 RepID=A0A835JU68_9ROSI|nr:hypothetical protein SADUNF_Sadunf09G0051700 [Salix dunnii]